ncbi:MAG TPA: peroxide stress protein YaaA [Acidimicrobiales bacterium]|nr:peroxide stress protein YaaA [Acidimicrobiales bacterium]
MTERLLLLMPPSQSKAVGGRRSNKKGMFDDVLRVPRHEVLNAAQSFLTTATAKELTTTFNARGPLQERAMAAVRDFENGKVPLLPAWRRYEGVVWTHLDPSSLEPAQRRAVLILSAFYGLLSCEDPIADYRLKMNASLAPLGTLAQFWRPTLTPLLEERSRNRTIVSFLPQEHAASIDFSTLSRSREIIHVHFVAADESRAVGHDAKAVKGVLARRLLDEGGDVFHSFEWQGWRARRQDNDVYVSAPQRGAALPVCPPSS